MGKFARLSGALVTAALLAGCVAAPDPFAAGQLQKGEPLAIRNILAAHPNKKACVKYEAGTNSCASIITSTVEGNTMISRERAALNVSGTGGVQNVELVTRSTLQGMRACARAEDVSVTGRDAVSAALLAVTRDTINQFGGAVCATYFRSGVGYIVTTTGANGKPFPPGDTQIQFLLGDVKLRTQ